MQCPSHVPYDVGKLPKAGAYRANARLSGLAHLKCKGGWEDTLLPPAHTRKLLKVRSVEAGQSLQVLSRRTGALKPLPDGCYHYAVSPKGALYIDHRGAYGTHAAMMKFRPVQAAGHVTITKHRIVCMDNVSGHYLPTEEQFLQTAADLKAAGLVGPEVALLGWDLTPRQLSWLQGAEEFIPGAMRSLQRTDTPEQVIRLRKTALGTVQLAPYAVAWACKSLLGVVTGRGRAAGWWLRGALVARFTAECHDLYMRFRDDAPARPWSPEPIYVQKGSMLQSQPAQAASSGV